MRPFAAVTCVLLACAPSPSPSPPPSPSPSPPPFSSTAATAPDASSAATEDASAPLRPEPPPVERTGKTWPFHAWDRAEAFTFNRFQMRPGAPFRIVDENGWSPHIADKKPLDGAQAKQAVDLVLAGKSELEMTKCPFPRHAVVLYDHDSPVASINVCFECGDVLLWPRWGKDDFSESALKQRDKLFAQVFLKWKTFFRDSVGYPIDEKWH